MIETADRSDGFDRFDLIRKILTWTMKPSKQRLKMKITQYYRTGVVILDIQFSDCDWQQVFF